MSNIVILGAGTFAIEVLEAIELGGAMTPVGFLVSEDSFADRPVHAGLPIATLDRAPWPPETTLAIGGIVTAARRAFVLAVELRGFRFASVRHPSAIVSPRAAVGAGTFVGAGAIVASNARIQEHVVLNRGANLGHDASIAPFATIGPGAVIAGCVTIGARAFIGAGVVVRDHVSIGEGAVVTAGAVVVTPVPAHVVVAGVPARIVRKGVDGM